MANAKKDENGIPVLMGVSNVDGTTPVMVYVDPVTHRLLVDFAGGSGTVTSVSVVTANGVSGSVATATTTPAITLTLGAITPTGVLISGLTASELVATDASKNLVSLAIATYPSLTELTYVKGVTSAIQTQLGAKAPSTAPTFATSITGSYLTASEILITDGSKNIVSAPVATYPSLTELSYVKGATSAIQTQIGAKLNTADIDDIAVNGETTAPISSNWAYDHENSTTAHGATGANVGTTNTQTLTNKRVTKRTGTTTSHATPTINTDNVDEYYITAQAEAITSFTTNLSGTPTLGQTLFISVIGTAARAITWGASFANGPVSLPTTTVTTTQLSTLLKWDGSIWRCYATGSTV